MIHTAALQFHSFLVGCDAKGGEDESELLSFPPPLPLFYTFLEADVPLN